MKEYSISKNLQTIDIFKDIVFPLKNNFDLSFGYMIVFNDGYYYLVSEDLDFLSNFVENTQTSSVFCEDDITSSFDAGYRLTLWPDNPLDKAMQVCYEHKVWNGITISLEKKNFTELWWFTGSNSNTRKFFIRNKDLLMRFIHYFNHRKQELFIHENLDKRNLFKFEKGFSVKKECSDLDNEKEKVRNFLEEMRSRNFILQTECGKIVFSAKEVQILSLISSGLTTELAALRMNIAPATARHYIENIKIKLHQGKKIQLIDFYLHTFKKFFE